jgi:hypothetical protein
MAALRACIDSRDREGSSKNRICTAILLETRMYEVRLCKDSASMEGLSIECLFNSLGVARERPQSSHDSVRSIYELSQSDGRPVRDGFETLTVKAGDGARIGLLAETHCGGMSRFLQERCRGCRNRTEQHATHMLRCSMRQ